MLRPTWDLYRALESAGCGIPIMPFSAEMASDIAEIFLIHNANNDQPPPSFQDFGPICASPSAVVHATTYVEKSNRFWAPPRVSRFHSIHSPASRQEPPSRLDMDIVRDCCDPKRYMLGLGYLRGGNVKSVMAWDGVVIAGVDGGRIYVYEYFYI